MLATMRCFPMPSPSLSFSSEAYKYTEHPALDRSSRASSDDVSCATTWSRSLHRYGSYACVSAEGMRVGTCESLPGTWGFATYNFL